MWSFLLIQIMFACKDWGLAYLGRDHNVLGGIELLGAAQVHRLLQQRNDIWVKSFPVGVLEVVLLALYGCAKRWC